MVTDLKSSFVNELEHQPEPSHCNIGSICSVRFVLAEGFANCPPIETDGRVSICVVRSVWQINQNIVIPNHDEW